MSEHIISLLSANASQGYHSMYSSINQSKLSNELGKADCGTLDRTIKYHTSGDIRACTCCWYNPTIRIRKSPSTRLQTRSLTSHGSRSILMDS